MRLLANPSPESSPMKLTSALLFLSFALAGEIAGAQTGTIDQVSTTQAIPPVQSAGFNGDATSLTWQAEVNAGLTGQLEGFTLRLTGPQGATLATALRLGPGWNTGPAAFQMVISKPTSGTDDVFVNATSANINVAPGTHFVIEMQGQGTGCGIVGTYVPPAAGSPVYPELLYLNGPGCFADCGWRIAFTTYVLNSAGTSFCSGDGSGTACPCGNSGAAGNGCASSVNASGGHLAGTGSASIAGDTFTLTGSGLPNSSALYFQGTMQIAGGAGSVFGDGLRCAGGTVIRLGTKTNVSGTSSYPSGTDTPISIKGANSAGAVRDYQCWYRNAAAFCTASTFNLTNGIAVTWTP
jgi:hypothetical protein